MKNLFKKKWSMPGEDFLAQIKSSFKVSEKIIFYILVFILMISSISIVFKLNQNFLIDTPAEGGFFSEGIIGTPRFLNPVLAISDADRDIDSLVYSGLLKSTKDGLIEDLAESYKISEDGLVYTFILRPNIYFHDGKKITSDDVLFTIQKIKDPNLKSPKRSAFENVTVEKIDDKILKFSLKQPYSPFIQNLTLGIIPKHIWKNLDDDNFTFSSFNINPVGSGPYKIENVSSDNYGIPHKYTLTPFKKYILGKAYIKKIEFVFYQDENELLEAYKNNEIDNLGSLSPENIKKIDRKKSTIKTSSLPRIFAVFFNQNSNTIFIDKEVRSALDTAINKKILIDKILNGYGKEEDGPLPETKIASSTGSIEEARKILENSGWKINGLGIYEKKDGKDIKKLAFSISTADTEELKNTAIFLQETWQKMGADVELKIFEIGDLNQNIIRPRKYDALLFGEIIDKNLDIYPFWHSSQRNDPGLNISMYANIKTDKILEELRKTSDPKKQDELISQFTYEVKKDSAAIFLYSPYFIYGHKNEINNIQFGEIDIQADRFSNINKWYIEKNKIWKIFQK